MHVLSATEQTLSEPTRRNGKLVEQTLTMRVKTDEGVEFEIEVLLDKNRKPLHSFTKRLTDLALDPVLAMWACHEAAECLSVGMDLTRRLWDFQNQATHPTPMGGDPGEQPGTVEVPGEQLTKDRNDTVAHIWPHLTIEERVRLMEAYRWEHPS